MSINGANKTAGGGYTLPQNAFIPHDSTRTFGGPGGAGHVNHPAVTSGMVQTSGVFSQPAPNVHGIENLPLVRIFGRRGTGG